MYYSREIDRKLLEWKEEKQRKPLLLRGARQVGKSTSVRHLAENFSFFAEVNFEKREAAQEFFNGDLDVREIASKLSAYLNVPILPGETLLFLDEIQECPRAIEALRFFKEDFPELHVIAAGSLLEFALLELPTFAVGRLRSLYVYPMSFDEFLTAGGDGGLISVKRTASPDHPLEMAFHNRLVESFRIYLLIGGMPEAVAKWLDTGEYPAVAQIQDDIITTYEDDFAKYRKRISPELLRLTVQGVLHSVGGKLVYSRVSGEYRSEQIKTALELLSLAGIVSPVTMTKANGLPLGSEADKRYRKYLYMDTGLYLRYLDLETGNGQEMVRQILTGAASELVNKGSLAEMAAGLELQKYQSRTVRRDLYYWARNEKNSIAEVDYLLPEGTEIIPLEVKAGTRGGMKSLYLFGELKGARRGVRSSLENFGSYQNKDMQVDVVPLYALSNLVGGLLR